MLRQPFVGRVIALVQVHFTRRLMFSLVVMTKMRLNRWARWGFRHMNTAIFNFWLEIRTVWSPFVQLWRVSVVPKPTCDKGIFTLVHICQVRHGLCFYKWNQFVRSALWSSVDYKFKQHVLTSNVGLHWISPGFSSSRLLWRPVTAMSSCFFVPSLDQHLNSCKWCIIFIAGLAWFSFSTTQWSSSS